MPSVFTHPLPALALAVCLGKNIVSPRLVVAAVAVSVLPDLDVAGFAFGVGYGEALGHRGLFHSTAFALGIAALAFCAAPLLRARRITAFMVTLCAIFSHILLDAATNGGLGVAFFWPVDETRYFLPWRPIVVCPFSPKVFFSSRGLSVMLSELRWVWGPCVLFALAGLALRRAARPPRRDISLTEGNLP